MSPLDVAIVVGILIAWWVAAKRRRYQAVGAAAHFGELGRALEELKAEGVEGRDPPAHYESSAGVTFVYTAEPVPEVEGLAAHYEHHFSFSYRGEPLALAASVLIVSYFADLLGYPPSGVQLFVTQTGVLHAVWRLSEDEHAQWRRRRVNAPSPEGIQARMEAAATATAKAALLERIEHVRLPGLPG